LPTEEEGREMSHENVIDNLQRFNRKERFHLLRFALDNPAFRLGVHFRDQLRATFGFDVPETAFSAMDYHLSWLYAALHLPVCQCAGSHEKGGGIELGNQEDVDLIIAFQEGGLTRILILEAKGVTGWSTKQLESKVDRLRDMFGMEQKQKFEAVTATFAILSPVRPTFVTRGRSLAAEISTLGWPTWMTDDRGQPYWIKLPTPEKLLKVTRCDADSKTSARGGFWKVEEDKTQRRMEFAMKRNQIGGLSV
jgi:hypothetical protein